MSIGSFDYVVHNGKVYEPQQHPHNNSSLLVYRGEFDERHVV